MTTRWFTAVLLTAGSLLAGCGPAVHNITMPAPGAITAAPAEATVVVIQPSTRFQSLNILDGEGKLVGQLNDRRSLDDASLARSARFGSPSGVARRSWL